MCGICGIYNKSGSPVETGLLDRMTTVMAHRGPDGSGSYVAPGVGLGHRRLSIIDLEGGTQPISNEDDSLWVVFNGEIYNFVELRQDLEARGHVFKTRSDTEVILHAYETWGADCVNQFNGIFAFALYDTKDKSLLLARDHLGVKPLYYVSLGDRLLFASEIKALLQDTLCPREVDSKSLGELFTFRYVPSPNTLFKGIKKLPPGHWMRCSTQGIEIKRYWNWTPNLLDGRRESDLIEEYQALLEDAVRLQMRSDVPVGLFLSSGVDSGTLLALMRQHTNEPVHTFTIGFEDGEKTNETDEAREFAERLGADHTQRIVTSNDYEKYFERYLWDLEEPVGHEPAPAFFFVSKLASEKVKVVLSGQGADEPWAGYHRYIGVKLSTLYSRFPAMLTGPFRALVERLPRNERLKRGAASLHESDPLTRFTKVYSFFSTEMKEKLFAGWLKREIGMDGVEPKEALRRLYSDVENLDPLTQMLYIDTRASLPDDLLMVNDKTSMANSIEARVPFLDYRLVQFIETIPPQLKLKGFRGKYLHKKAVERWLPKEVVYRKKKGFDNPIDNWLRKKMFSYAEDCLLSEKSSINTYFRRDYVRQLLRLHQEGKQDYLRQLYLLICFELWHRQFIRGYQS
jgi:asparagine synthase (glutamine-hydrolysing)